MFHMQNICSGLGAFSALPSLGASAGHRPSAASIKRVHDAQVSSPGSVAATVAIPVDWDRATWSGRGAARMACSSLAIVPVSVAVGSPIPRAGGAWTSARAVNRFGADGVGACV